MNGYTEITTQAGMDQLLERVAGFHDSMTKEVHLVNRGWVDPDRSMAMCHRFDVRLLIQSQCRPSAIELLFTGVGQLVTGSPGEYWGGSGVVEHVTELVEQTVIRINLDGGEFEIESERLFYRDRPDWLGQSSRFGTEVAQPEFVEALVLDETCWQCSACMATFDVTPESDYHHCPGCRVLTGRGS